MRNISFYATQVQIRARTKTVTRRLGWQSLQPGELLQAIVKGQGLKKGETIEPLGVIRVVNVRRERLDRMTKDLHYGPIEVQLEGFPYSSPVGFVKMFCELNDCRTSQIITRIQFVYEESAANG